MNRLAASGRAQLECLSERILKKISNGNLTIYQHAVREGVHGPDIWCPVSVAKASREWEQSLQDLRHLFVVQEWSKCNASNRADAQTQLDAVGELDMENGTRSKAIRAQEVDKVCRSQVEVDVLEAEQGGEDKTASQETGVVPCKDD